MNLNEYTINYSSDISFGQVANEVFVINEITQKAYLLRNFSRDFWMSINSGITVSKLYDILRNSYNLESNILLEKIHSNISKYVRESLLVLKHNK